MWPQKPGVIAATSPVKDSWAAIKSKPAGTVSLGPRISLVQLHEGTFHSLSWKHLTKTEKHHCIPQNWSTKTDKEKAVACTKLVNTSGHQWPSWREFCNFNLRKKGGKSEDSSHASWHSSCYGRCFTKAASPQKLLSQKSQFKYPSLQGAEISKMSHSIQTHPQLFLLPGGDDAASVLKAGIKKTEIGFEPLSRARSRPNAREGKASVFWVACPPAGFQHRILLLWASLWIPDAGGP